MKNYDIEEYGDRGCMWTSDGTDYRTNGDGDGLWIYDDRRCEWKQSLGTCQFSLPDYDGTDKQTARIVMRLRRHDMEPDDIDARDAEEAAELEEILEA